MASYYEQINNIKQDVGRMAAEITRRLSEKAREDLISAHDKIITQFYAAHTPTSYHRHGIGGLYYSLLPQPVMHSGKKSIASISVGSTDMEDHYRTDPEVVFDLMWNHGVRGLPHHGNKALTHTYTFPPGSSNVFHAGEQWVNPYWSGENDPYHNIFLTNIRVGSYTSKTAIPHLVMCDIVEHWDKVSGKKLSSQLVNSIK